MGIYINGQESKGPYGYLCLGLSYDWNNEKRMWALEKMILVHMDLKRRACIEFPLYYDMLEREIVIKEKDGKYYYQDCPILNFDMLEMPDRLDSVIEENGPIGERNRVFINSNGRTKYSVNRCINHQKYFWGKYTELYACVIDYDKETLQGTLLGFDLLGKILRINFKLMGLSRVQDIRQTLLKHMVYDLKIDEENNASKKGSGILNFDYFLDENGGIIFEYNSIWE